MVPKNGSRKFPCWGSGKFVCRTILLTYRLLYLVENISAGVNCGEHIGWYILWRTYWLVYLVESILAGVFCGEHIGWDILWRTYKVVYLVQNIIAGMSFGELIDWYISLRTYTLVYWNILVGISRGGFHLKVSDFNTIFC